MKTKHTTLALIFGFLFLLAFTSASKWDLPVGSSSGGGIIVVNGDEVFNGTQFEYDNGNVSIKTNWLNTFVQGLTKWNNYFSKGESDSRYLQSFTESDPIYNSEKGNYYLKTNPFNFYNSTSLQNLSQLNDDLGYSNYNDSWINQTFYNKTQSDDRYLQSFTEVDPVWNSEKEDYYLKSNPFNFYNSTTLPLPDFTNFYTKSEVYNKTQSDDRYYPNTNPLNFINLSQVPITDLTDYYNKTEIDNRYSNNTGDQDLSNYYNKTSNLNAVGYNVTADYYYGNASYMTGIPSPDLSAYFTLDQTNPQTISNGAPIFSKGLKVNADNEKIVMGAGNDSEEYFDGSNQIHKTAGYHYFYTNAGNKPVTIGHYSGVNKIVSQIPLTIMSATIPIGVDTGLVLSSSENLIDFYTGGSIKLKLSLLSGNTAFYPNADKGLSLGGTTKRFYNGFFAGSISNYADNSKHFWGAANDASIHYDGTNLIFNTDAVGSGLAYFSNNVSATGYITRTTIYDKEKGSALDWVKDSSQLKDTKGIDHTQFYGYTKYNVTDYSKPILKEICKEEEGEKGLLITECENQTTYGTKEEEGVLLDEEIAMLTQAVYELKQQNQFLQEQINNLTGKDIKLEEANTRQDEALCTIKLFSWCLIK